MILFGSAVIETIYLPFLFVFLTSQSQGQIRMNVVCANIYSITNTRQRTLQRPPLPLSNKLWTSVFQSTSSSSSLW